MRIQLPSFAISIFAIFVTGCDSQPVKPESPPIAPEEASSIQYQLPVTSIQVKADLVLQACVDKNGASLPVAKASIAATPVVRPSPFNAHYLTIRGSDLSSVIKKRDVKIDLYPSGALKSINSTVADRSTAIVGGILKLATSILMFDAQKDKALKATTGCNPATTAAVNRVNELKDKIKAHQEAFAQALLSGDARKTRMEKKAIDATALEISRLQTTYLALSVTRSLDFSKTSKGGVINWNASELEKWLIAPSGAAFLPNFSLAYCLSKSTPAGIADTACTNDIADRLSSANSTPAAAEAITCKSDPDCSKTIVLREPMPAQIIVIAHSNDLGVDIEKELVKTAFPMAQWGDFSYLRLSVGFGGSKTISLGLDEYGRRVSFGWSSGARAEEVLTGLQGAADSANALHGQIVGRELKEQKLQIDELETQQKLNKLRRCEAIINAGGFVCPAE